MGSLVSCTTAMYVGDRMSVVVAVPASAQPGQEADAVMSRTAKGFTLPGPAVLTRMWQWCSGFQRAATCRESGKLEK